MIDPRALATLVCPETRQPLRLADESLIARLNRAVANGTLSTKSGQRVERPLAGGLLRQDEAMLYPIVDNIPVLLADEAIPLPPNT
jgi:uncharacterized protein YbaR (Trm112 family)